MNGFPSQTTRELTRRESIGRFTQVFGITPLEAIVTRSSLVEDRLIKLAIEDLLSSELSYPRFEYAFELASQHLNYIRIENQLEIFMRAVRQLSQQCLELQQLLYSQIANDA